MLVHESNVVSWNTAPGSPDGPAFERGDKNNSRFVVCAQAFNSIGLANNQDMAMGDLAGMGFPTVNEDLFAWPQRTDRLSFVCMQNTRYDRNQDGNGMTYAVLENRNGDRFLC